MRLPYPGLRPFRRDESDLFFGREGSVDDLVDKLAATRFLAVLGTSGSGKSSLVRTGLLDALELGLSPQMGAAWRIADLRPGDRPLHSLAGALLGVAAQDGGHRDRVDVDLLSGFLARGPRSLVTWCQDGNLPPSTNLLVLVDQFEELFRFEEHPDREEAEAFVSLLLQSASEPGSRIYIVVTMRSEFLGACSLMPGLAERINAGMYLTSRMSREQCREAIEGPAAVTGFGLEPALVNRLLNDLASFAPWEDDAAGSGQLQRISRRADQLPLMQHVLNRLWLRSEPGSGPVLLTLHDYETIGGLSGALDEHGAEILRRLGPEREKQVQALFRALVTGNSLATAVRRPVPFATLAAVCGDETAARQVVDEFRSDACNFLQPPLSVPLEAGTMVDITHESLIRQWHVLAGWLLAEAKAVEGWQQLRRSAQRQMAGEGDLLHGLDLANANAWWTAEQPTPEWAARFGGQFEETRAFLEASRAQERAAKKSRRSLRITSWSMAAGLVLAITLALVKTRAQNEQLASLNERLLPYRDAMNLASTLKDRQFSRNPLISSDDMGIALGGNDPVSYFKPDGPMPGTAEQFVIRDGAIWLFSSAENKRLFEAEPARYMPAFGGFCAPCMYLRSIKHGRPQYSWVHGGRLYLASSRELIELFKTFPEEVIEATRELWIEERPAPEKHGSPAGSASASGESVTDALARELPAAYAALRRQALAMSPNLRTAVGQGLVPYALAEQLPDAYMVLRQQAIDLGKADQWPEAVVRQEAVVQRLLKLPAGHPLRAELPGAYHSLGWYQLRSGLAEVASMERAALSGLKVAPAKSGLVEFSGAEHSAREGLKLHPQSLELQALLGHALLVQGQVQAATDIYRQHLGEVIRGKQSWEEEVAEGLNELKERGAKGTDSPAIRDMLQSSMNGYAALQARADAFQARKAWPQAVQAQQAVIAYLVRLGEESRRHQDLPDAYSLLSYYQLLARDYAGVLSLGTEATGPKDGGEVARRRLEINKAHALLLQGRRDEAMEIYELHRGKDADISVGWEALVLDSLETMKRFGLWHPGLADVQGRMKASAEYIKLKVVAATLVEAKAWSNAVTTQRGVVDLLERLPRTDRLRPELEHEYNSLAWYQLFARDFAAALDSTDRGLAQNPQSVVLQTNRAHALLLLDRAGEADKLYLGNRGKKVDETSDWSATILEDFDKLEDSGIKHPGFARVRLLLKQP